MVPDVQSSQQAEITSARTRETQHNMYILRMGSPGKSPKTIPPSIPQRGNSFAAYIRDDSLGHMYGYVTKSHRNPRGSFYLTQESGIGLSEAISELTGDISALGCSRGSALPQQPGAPPGGKAGGKASPHKPPSLCLGAKSLPEAPGALLTPHWPELCHVTPVTTEAAGTMETWQPSSEEGTARLSGRQSTLLHTQTVTG